MAIPWTETDCIAVHIGSCISDHALHDDNGFWGNVSEPSVSDPRHYRAICAEPTVCEWLWSEVARL